MDTHVKTLEGLKNNQIRMTINKTVKNDGPKIIKTIPLTQSPVICQKPERIPISENACDDQQGDIED